MDGNAFDNRALENTILYGCTFVIGCEIRVSPWPCYLVEAMDGNYLECS